MKFFVSENKRAYGNFFMLSFLILPVFAGCTEKNADVIEKAENYLLSKEAVMKNTEYRYDLFEKADGKFIIVLSNNAEGKTYATQEVILLDNELMENRDASEIIIHAGLTDSSRHENMESCGLKCKARFREFLKEAVIRTDIMDLRYSGINSFRGVGKMYVRQKEAVLDNKERFTNSHMLRNTGTGALIIPDESDGCYRNLDLRTGKTTGEPIEPGLCLR